MDLLTLDQSLKLEASAANRLYAHHLNPYLLQIYKILGMDEMDIKSADGVQVFLRNGRTLLDFSAGMGIVGIGHNHPRILAAERRCHDEKIIDCIKVAPHPLQGALAYNLAQFLPRPLDVSFFSVSGTEAVEAALKVCERAQGAKRSKFICMQGSFHGKSHGSLSVTTAGRFQNGFLMGIPAENVIAVPYGDIAALKSALGPDVIAVIVEPIRGEAAEVPPRGYLPELVKLARAHSVLTIFDEVKVGMGRSGKFCAFQHEDVVPDVVTLAKTLGGGKREMGVMVTSKKIFDRAYGNKSDCTLHTSGFSGLGESCAVAIETLNILQDENIIGRAGDLGAYFRTELETLRNKFPATILEVRGMGLFQAISLNFQQSFASQLIDCTNNSLFKTYQSVLIAGLVRELYENYSILVHFQPGALNVLHFVPPMVVTKGQIDVVISALDKIFSAGISDSTLKFIGKNLKSVLTFS